MIDMAQMKSVKGWVKTTIIAAIGGGIAGVVAAFMDPSKFQFPQDFGSGRLWKFFLQGFLVTFGALVLKSPFGQKIVGEFKDAEAGLQQDQATVADARSRLKH